MGTLRKICAPISGPTLLFLIWNCHCISILSASFETPSLIYLDLMPLLEGPGVDRSGDGVLSNPRFTVDEKLTLYTFLRVINELRNNKTTGDTLVSGNIDMRKSRGDDRREENHEKLNNLIIERNKHDHEENSLHDHWAEAEHSHAHQESSAAQSENEETHSHSHTHTHYHDHNHIRKHSENHQHLAEYFFSGWKR